MKSIRASFLFLFSMLMLGGGLLAQQGEGLPRPRLGLYMEVGAGNLFGWEATQVATRAGIYFKAPLTGGLGLRAEGGVSLLADRDEYRTTGSNSSSRTYASFYYRFADLSPMLEILPARRLHFAAGPYAGLLVSQRSTQFEVITYNSGTSVGNYTEGSMRQFMPLLDWGVRGAVAFQLQPWVSLELTYTQGIPNLSPVGNAVPMRARAVYLGFFCDLWKPKAAAQGI